MVKNVDEKVKMSLKIMFGGTIRMGIFVGVFPFCCLLLVADAVTWASGYGAYQNRHLIKVTSVGVWKWRWGDQDQATLFTSKWKVVALIRILQKYFLQIEINWNVELTMKKTGCQTSIWFLSTPAADSSTSGSEPVHAGSTHPRFVFFTRIWETLATCEPCTPAMPIQKATTMTK